MTSARVLPRVDVNVTGGTHPGLETASGGKAGIDLGEAIGASVSAWRTSK